MLCASVCRGVALLIPPGVHKEGKDEKITNSGSPFGFILGGCDGSGLGWCRDNALCDGRRRTNYMFLVMAVDKMCREGH